MAKILYRNASDIRIKAYDWIWLDRFARGKLTSIAGNPGLGKSQLVIAMISIITNGTYWPDGSIAQTGSVIILSAEDGADDTIVPRLKAVNADLNKVKIIDAVQKDNKSKNQFNLNTDLAALSQFITEIGDVVAIFIDPISAYLGKVDDRNNSEVRGMLAPLAKLAEVHNIAIICISHNNKNVSQEAIFRSIGSIGFVAAARAAFCVVKDKEDENKRYFLPVKNNIGDDKNGFAFTIEQVQLNENSIKTSRIVWLKDIVTLTANEAMKTEIDPNERSAVEEAMEFLLILLENDSMFMTDIQREAEGVGYTLATLRRAKKKLGIKAVKCGMKKGWVWALPEKMININEDAQQKT